jgi:hypothetical protein
MYQNKYLKYKNKYLELKKKQNYFGGAKILFLIAEGIDKSLFNLNPKIKDSFSDEDKIIFDFSKDSPIFKEILKIIKENNFFIKNNRQYIQNVDEISDGRYTITNISPALPPPVPPAGSGSNASAAASSATSPAGSGSNASAAASSVSDPSYIDILVPHEPIRPIYICDSHYTRVTSNSIPINAVFDTGNSARTLVSEECVRRHNLIRKPIKATTVNINSFNLLMKSVNLEANAIKPITKTTPKKTGVATFASAAEDSVSDAENYEYPVTLLGSLVHICMQNIDKLITFAACLDAEAGDSSCDKNEKINFILSMIGVPIVKGVGGATIIILEEVQVPIEINIFGYDGPEDTILKFLLTGHIAGTTELLICNDDIRKLSNLGLIIGYNRIINEKRDALEKKQKERNEKIGKFKLFLNLMKKQGITTKEGELYVNQIMKLEQELHSIGSEIQILSQLDLPAFRI